MMDNENKYIKAQELFVENKMLAEKEGNEARIKSNKERIWMILYEIITAYSMKLYSNEDDIRRELKLGVKDIETIIYVINNYNEEKGNLENFTNMVWSRRKKLTKEEIDKGYGDAAGTGKLKPSDVQTEDGDNKGGVIDIPAPDNGTSPSGIEVVEERMANIIEIISAINQLYQKKLSKNSAGIKLVFTDKITDICKNAIDNIDSPLILYRQKSIIDGMDMGFLDFYMKEKCRTLRKIKITNLKKWGELPFKNGLVKEKDKALELDLPLSNKVYVCFLCSIDGLRQAAESTVSQYKNKFNDILKEVGLASIVKEIASLYNKNIDNIAIKEKLGYVTNTPLLDVILDYFETGQNSKGIKTSVKEIYSEIDKFMEEKCGKIMDKYLLAKEKEKDWTEEYKIKYAKLHINDFISGWQNNFDQKYNYIKNRKVEGNVPEYIKSLALQEIEKKITKDKDDIVIILKSLDYEFAERKMDYGYTILENITNKASADVKNTTIKEVSREVLEDTRITQRLINDTIYAICNSSSRSITTIVKKIQNDNLYSYYWM